MFDVNSGPLSSNKTRQFRLDVRIIFYLTGCKEPELLTQGLFGGLIFWGCFGRISIEAEHCLSVPQYATLISTSGLLSHLRDIWVSRLT